MALKAKISKQDEFDKLDPVVQKEYTKRGDAWFLIVDKVDNLSLEDVGGLRSALENEKEENRQLKAKVQAFGELTPEQATAAIETAKRLASAVPEDKVKAQIEEHGKQLTEKHSGELKKRDERNGFLTRELERNLIENAATAAIAKHKGRVKLLLPIIRSQLKMVEEDGQLHARVVNAKGVQQITRRDGADGPMSIEEYVESLKSQEDYQGAFDAPDASGGGSENDDTTTKKPAERSGGGNGKPIQINQSDTDAINNNVDKIASGEAVVVMGK